ncbi:hypothetical protein J6590_100783 [Homalodisca vitripennis]|nr:hypothetical protein J6590_100783 [Homalodisca vitripennis]
MIMGNNLSPVTLEEGEARLLFNADMAIHEEISINLSHVSSEEGKNSSEPASPFKTGRVWHPLCLGYQEPLTPKERTPLTPRVMSGIRLDLSITLAPQNLDMCGCRFWTFIRLLRFKSHFGCYCAKGGFN